eukprot:TRINITY_DN7072_c0_g1_i1.p1 TRINITY_DN7072_c0_g1~~TRINITY_DN7072_c0_g1_i1.p1  ORF type:complete len:550 (+),score=72.42 TRINITY_DN7072_c0_g1_i1:45-1694(+)
MHRYGAHCVWVMRRCCSLQLWHVYIKKHPDKRTADLIVIHEDGKTQAFPPLVVPPSWVSPAGATRQVGVSGTTHNRVAESHHHAIRSRRAAKDIDRSFPCEVDDCTKRYGTDAALKMHIRFKHPGSTAALEMALSPAHLADLSGPATLESLKRSTLASKPAAQPLPTLLPMPKTTATLAYPVSVPVLTTAPITTASVHSTVLPLFASPELIARLKQAQSSFSTVARQPSGIVSATPTTPATSSTSPAVVQGPQLTAVAPASARAVTSTTPATQPSSSTAAAAPDQQLSIAATTIEPSITAPIYSDNRKEISNTSSSSSKRNKPIARLPNVSPGTDPGVHTVQCTELRIGQFRAPTHTSQYRITAQFPTAESAGPRAVVWNLADMQIGAVPRARELFHRRLTMKVSDIAGFGVSSKALSACQHESDRADREAARPDGVWLTVEFARPPVFSFFDPQLKQWREMQDFTAPRLQALTFRRHSLRFDSADLLRSPIQQLLSAEPRLQALAERGIPMVPKYPYFTDVPGLLTAGDCDRLVCVVWCGVVLGLCCE